MVNYYTLYFEINHFEEEICVLKVNGGVGKEGIRIYILCLLSRSQKSTFLAKTFNLENYVNEEYIHQDIIEYSELLFKKIFNIIDRCLKIFCEAYINLKDTELNKSAYQSLKRKRKKYRFKSF